MSSVSYFWGDLDSSNDLPLYDLLMINLFIFNVCLWFLCFVDCVHNIFRNGRSDGFLRHISFFSVSFIPSLKISSVVVTIDFLEEMISVLALLYPVYQKTKVILPAISISVYPRPQQSTTLNKTPVNQSFSFKSCFILKTWSN